MGEKLKTEYKENCIVYAFFAIVLIFYFFQYLNPSVIANATDILSQQYLWESFLHEQLHSAPSFASWMPHVNGGTTIGGALDKFFRPLSLPFYYFFSPNYAMSLDFILHFWLMALGTYLYVKAIGLTTLPAVLSALFFTLSAGQVTLVNAGHIGKIDTIAWTPLVFWSIELGLKYRKWTSFLVAGLMLSLQLYEGHIQVSFYVCLAVAIYFISRTTVMYLKKEIDGKELGKLYGFGVLMVTVFFAVSAFTLIKWFEFKAMSDRGEGTSYTFATTWSMPPKELLTYLVPQLFGLSRANYKDPGSIDVFYWGEMPFTQNSDYMGLLPLLLSVIALIKCRNRYVFTAIGIALFFQVLAMGKYTPIYYFFYKYLGFEFFRVPKMNLFLVSFFTAITAGYGAQWLLNSLGQGDRKVLKRLIGGGIVFLILFCVISIYAQIQSDDLIRYFLKDLTGAGRSYNPAKVSARYFNAISGMWSAIVLLVIMFSIVSFRLFKYFQPRYLFCLLFIFFIIDVSLVNYKLLSVVDMKGNAYFSKDTAINFFEKDKGLYRVLNAVQERSPKTIAYLTPNKYILFNIHSLTGYEAVQVARYNDILGRLNLQGRMLDFLNVKYVVIDKSAFPGSVGARVGKFKVVVDADVKILENTRVFPRVFPLHSAKVLNDGRRILNALVDSPVNLRETLFLEKNVEMVLSSDPKPVSQSSAEVVSYQNNEIIIRSNMADNGFVFLSEKFYPGWIAYVDGQARDVLKANYIFRAVALSSGKHEVVLRYEPSSNKIGLAITLMSFLIVIGMLCYYSNIMRRQQRGGIAN